jgi:hypothetical protein
MRMATFVAFSALLLSATTIVLAEPTPPPTAQVTEKGGETPRLGKSDSCYAICKYRDGEGSEFIGTSGVSCDEACISAADQCLKEGEGNCEKFTCAMPGCQ